MRPQKPLCQPRHRVVHRTGTTLVFARDGRHVRVLTLPRHCGRVFLHQHWDDCFGAETHDGIEVWWPWTPLTPPDPSRN